MKVKRIGISSVVAIMLACAPDMIAAASTTQPMMTRDRGKTWSLVRGLPSRVRVIADKADARRFYAIDFAANRVVRSDDGVASLAQIASMGLPADLSGARDRAVGRQSAARGAGPRGIALAADLTGSLPVD